MKAVDTSGDGKIQYEGEQEYFSMSRDRGF